MRTLAIPALLLAAVTWPIAALIAWVVGRARGDDQDLAWYNAKEAAGKAAGLVAMIALLGTLLLLFFR